MKKRPVPKFFRHLDGLNVRAVFSDCGKYRYLLKIDKDIEKQGKHVCVVMLNPSVADEKQADKSVQFLEKLIFEKTSPYLENATSLSIVNLFAYIQTRQFKGSKKQIGALNDQYLLESISKAHIILIAWGKTCGYPERQAVVMRMLEKFPEKDVFTTNSHPSRGTYVDFVRPLGT